MIVNIGSTGRETSIEKLRGGDCFYYGGWYYMKLAHEVIDNDDELYAIGYNSIHLDDGTLTCIGEKDKIIPVEAVVTIDLKKS